MRFVGREHAGISIGADEAIIGGVRNMYNYKQLKLGKHGLPTWDGLIPVVMQLAGEQEEWQSRDLVKKAADSMNLPAKLRNQTYEKYPDDNILENRVAWTLSDLAISGLLDRPRRGTYRITELGKKLIEQYGINLGAKEIHAQEAYKAHQRELKQRKLKPSADSEQTEDVPATHKIDEIQRQIEDYNSEIAADLLERIREAEPGFFENLVADLLSRMGYQGPEGKTMVTPQSRDGGIDGIINQDPLGTSTVYFQAKRYAADNIVQRPAIQGFYGALSSVHADRGVFISTSSFSEGAKEQAKSFSIVLIDGIRLTQLLLHYHVGVQAKKNYDLFQIDEDYFS